MEIAELPREGLLRRFRVVLPPGPIGTECARRLAELAAGLDQNGALPEAQRSAMLRRSEAAIHADILGQAIERAIANILRDFGIRPAARPSITLEPRATDGAHVVAISLEALPEVTPPELGTITLDCVTAEPDAAEVDAALQALRRRHGVWHALNDAGAAPGDEITCDISAWVAPNLLRNPGAQCVDEHGQALPLHWELLPHGTLVPRVAGSGMTDGHGYLDLRYQGRVTPDTPAVLAFDARNAVPAAPGQLFTLMADIRLVAGVLPQDVEVTLSLDEFAGPAPRALGAHAARVMPGDGADSPALVSLAAQAGADAALSHIRAALYVGGTAHDAVDFTLRVASPCLLSPTLPPATPHPALRAERFAWRLGEDGALPGLDPELAGLRPGEVRRVSLTAPLRSAALPDELAGRELVVEARAHALRRLELPPLDEEFAKLCGQTDLAALRVSLADDLRQEFAAMTVRLLRHALLARLADADAAQGLPPSLVEAEYRMLAKTAPQSEGATLRALAERRLRLRMVLRKLGEGFGLNIAARDLEAALTQEAARFPGQEAEALAFLRGNAAAARRVADQLWTRRVIEHALTRVQLREQVVSASALRDAATRAAAGPGLDDAHG